MPSMLGIVLGVLFASGTTLGAWYVAFDAGMVRNDPASAIAGAAGVFAYYDDEEEEIDVDFEEDSVQDPNGNSSWPSESEGADGADDGSWWWEDDDVEVEVDVEDDNGGSWGWEDDDGDIEPSYDDEIYIDEPYYYDDVEEYEVIDEWDEYEVVQNQRAAQQANQPWYVKAFPGIGSMLQQILPGQQAPAPRPPPPVQQRPTYPQPSCWVSAQPSLVASGGSSVIISADTPRPTSPRAAAPAARPAKTPVPTAFMLGLGPTLACRFGRLVRHKLGVLQRHPRRPHRLRGSVGRGLAHRPEHHEHPYVHALRRGAGWERQLLHARHRTAAGLRPALVHHLRESRRHQSGRIRQPCMGFAKCELGDALRHGPRPDAGGRVRQPDTNDHVYPYGRRLLRTVKLVYRTPLRGVEHV